MSHNWCRHSSCRDWTTATQPWLAFRLTFSSRSWTRLRDSCSLRRSTTTSLLSSTNCTGWQLRRGSIGSSLLFSCTSVCMRQHRRISPMSSSTQLIFEARRRLRCASSLSLNVRRTRLSTVGDRAFLVAAARRCPYLEQSAAARHVRTFYVWFWGHLKVSFSGVPFHEF